MNTLNFTTVNEPQNDERKEEVIKEINAFRLKNKNKWYQINLNFKGLNYKLKCYNTWVQLAYVYENDTLLKNDGSVLDMKVGEYKNYLRNLIK